MAQSLATMAVHQCIPSWTYDEAFYKALVAGTDMCIRTHPVKGKGLFAVRPVTNGAVVMEETALCCSQDMDDLTRGIPVCLHCLKSLETPRRIIATGCRTA